MFIALVDDHEFFRRFSPIAEREGAARRALPHDVDEIAVRALQTQCIGSRPSPHARKQLRTEPACNLAGAILFSLVRVFASAAGRKILTC